MKDMPLDASIHTDVAGPAGAPLLVLAHGSVVTRKLWLPQMRGLSAYFRVIAPDLPGHGSLAGLRFTLGGAADVLENVIESEGGPALVAGLSMGGYAVMELASRRADLASGIVLSGCSFNFRGPAGLFVKCVSALMRRGWLRQSVSRAQEKTRAMYPPALAADLNDQLAAGVYPDALGDVFAELAGIDFAERIASYPGPALILNGEKDRSSRSGEGHFLSRMKNARVRTIAGAGHGCSLDKPEEFNAAVLEFGRMVFGSARFSLSPP